MKSKREKLLLGLAAWSVLAAGMAVFLLGQLGRRQEIGRQMRLLETRALQAAAHQADEEPLRLAIRDLSAAVEGEKQRLYRRDEIDPYRFGSLVRSRLLEAGLEIRRYQPQESGGQTLLEFAVRGDALGLASFLQAAAGSPKRWLLPFVSVNAAEQAGTVQAVLRVTYESLEDLAP